MRGFPTIEEVEKADKEQLARWYRFVPSGDTAADQKIMKRIAERFDKLGGMTPELSKGKPFLFAARVAFQFSQSLRNSCLSNLDFIYLAIGFHFHNDPQNELLPLRVEQNAHTHSVPLLAQYGLRADTFKSSVSTESV
jgi:hypothetical protein